MRVLTANARVFITVLENPEMTQQEIADLLGMRYQHVWRALNTLVQQNMLCKERRNRRTYFTAGKDLKQLDDIKRIKNCLI